MRRIVLTQRKKKHAPQIMNKTAGVKEHNACIIAHLQTRDQYKSPILILK